MMGDMDRLDRMAAEDDFRREMLRLVNRMSAQVAAMQVKLDEWIDREQEDDWWKRGEEPPI